MTKQRGRSGRVGRVGRVGRIPGSNGCGSATHLVRWLLRGAAAGAAGTTALDAATYLDMALRGRPASSTPEEMVDTLSRKAHLPIPGQGDERDNRLNGLGALGGLAAGVATGAAVGLTRGLGWRPGPVGTGLAALAAALLAGNGPMTAARVTDPRSWSAADWVSDLVPHVAYAVVTASVLQDLDDR